MRTSSCPAGFTLATVTSPRRLFLVAMVSALAVIPAGGGRAAPAKHRLHAFGSCSRFVHYARRHAGTELTTRGVPDGVPLPMVRNPQPGENGTVAPQAESTPTSGGAGQDFSTTNGEEAGVDEPDLVKTDGKRVFVAENGMLYALDARSSPPKLLGSLALDGYGQQLLLSGDRLLVLAGSPIVYPIRVVPPPRPTGPPTPAAGATIAYPYPGVQASTLSLVDVSDPAAMKVLKTMSVNGGYLDARLTGHTARVIFSATPRVLPLLQSVAAGTQQSKIARTTTPDWRATYKLRRGRTGKVARHALARCASIERPDVFAGLNSLTVLTIDIDKGL